MYYWDMKNKTLCGVVDPCVMNYGRISKKTLNIYINGGNYLIDVQNFKKDNIYEKSVENRNIYKTSITGLQNFLNDVAYGKIGYLPMKYGMFAPFSNDNKSDTPPYITDFYFIQRVKHHDIYPFLPNNKKSWDMQHYNPVIIHSWNGKWADGNGITIHRRIAQYYIKYAGIWDEMCEKHPGYCQK